MQFVLCTQLTRRDYDTEEVIISERSERCVRCDDGCESGCVSVKITKVQSVAEMSCVAATAKKISMNSRPLTVHLTGMMV